MNFLKKVWNRLTGQVETPKVQSTNVADTSKSVKDAKTLFNEGKNISAMMAGNAAANAGATAKANAMMNGGNRMTAALSGAQASSNAGLNTYNQMLNSATSTAQSQNQSVAKILADKAHADAAAYNTAASQNANVNLDAQKTEHNIFNNRLSSLADMFRNT